MTFEWAQGHQPRADLGIGATQLPARMSGAGPASGYGGGPGIICDKNMDHMPPWVSFRWLQNSR